MGLAKLNIWVSDVADPCGTWKEEGRMTVLDCKGVLSWPCGRYLAPGGKWLPVPNGTYKDLPFKCGHLEVELPPGCYWVVAGFVLLHKEYIHFNKTTHVGIVEVGCNEDACVKLFNPTVRLCWRWLLVGLQILAATPQAKINANAVNAIEKSVEDLLRDVPRLPIEGVIEDHFRDLVKAAASTKTS